MPSVANFNVANMSFKAICKKQILVKNSEITAFIRKQTSCSGPTCAQGY